MQSFARVAAITLVWNGSGRGACRICFRVVPVRALMRPASRRKNWQSDDDVSPSPHILVKGWA
jgi:hypothetical protein